VAIADDPPDGLSGSVWSGPGSGPLRSRAGTIGINGGHWQSPDVPYEG
jgi:hypothetical protein